MGTILLSFPLFLILMWFRSPEQHWTLMPTHAVLSTVRPSSFLYGPGSGYGGPNAMTFPQYVWVLRSYELVDEGP